MVDLSKVGQREALKRQREPYWHRLRPGCFVGYRPSAKGGAGTWVARTYDDDGSRYRLKALGSFGEPAAGSPSPAQKPSSGSDAMFMTIRSPRLSLPSSAGHMSQAGAIA